MIISKTTSNTINLLKCILCIGVVFIHAQFRPGESVLLFDTKWGGVDYQHLTSFFRFFVDLCLDKVCVPLFFSISGFLFFLKPPENDFLKWFLSKYKSRFSSLLVPYIIANGVFIAISVIGVVIQGGAIDMHKVFDGFWAYETGLPADPPLWFLRDLMLCVLFSPVIYFIIKKTSWLLPVSLGIMWITGYPHIGFVVWKLKAYFFFSIGAWLALRQIDCVEMVKKNWYILLYLVFYIIILASYLFFNYDCLLRISVIAGFPFFISIAKTISGKMKKTVSSSLVVATFFIFLYHYLIANLMWRLYCALIGTSEIALFASYFLGAVTTIAILYFVYCILNKITPKFTFVLVGGRG